jgi:Arc/MetJ-type ribon-helix-helix transcriptional regulator
MTVSKTYVETSTELLEGIDEMVREGYYANRTEGINDAIRLLLKQYKLSKLHAKDSHLMEKPATAGGEAREE